MDQRGHLTENYGLDSSVPSALGHLSNIPHPGCRDNAGELRMQLFSVAPASGEKVGVWGLSERIFPHPDPLPEGEGTLIQQH